MGEKEDEGERVIGDRESSDGEKMVMRVSLSMRMPACEKEYVNRCGLLIVGTYLFSCFVSTVCR